MTTFGLRFYQRKIRRLLRQINIKIDEVNKIFVLQNVLLFFTINNIHEFAANSFHFCYK